MAQLLPLFPVWCFYLFICQRCMNRLAKVCARYLGGHRGFSIGIEDVTPGTEVRTMQEGIRLSCLPPDLQESR